MALEDEVTEDELELWRGLEQKQQQEHEQCVILEGLIAHHELGLIIGSNTALALAEKMGLKKEFEQYLTSTERN